MKTYEEINEKIKQGKAVVFDAKEVIGIVKDHGVKKAAEMVDVVTTATFGPMCSSGAFMNFGHATPPIRMESISLNNVSCYGGLAAVDTYIGATQPSSDRGDEYGGAHVICDLIEGKKVSLKAFGKGTDCYPRKDVSRMVSLKDLNEAYLFNPRNAYQNYSAATNSSSRRIYTYMGTLGENFSNVTYSTSGELSPLLNDPYLRTIGMGTKIFFCGAQGYVVWNGTQFKTETEREANGVPNGGSATLALIGDMKAMDRAFIAPAVYERYGVSMFVGIGIPIPVLDEDMMAQLSVENKDIMTHIEDYSKRDGSDAVVRKVSYGELFSGSVEIHGKRVRTSPLSSVAKAIEIAGILKEQIKRGEFTLNEPIKTFDMHSSVKKLVRSGGEKK